MATADVNVRAVDAALELRPKALDGVHGRAAFRANILIARVVHGVMPIAHRAKPAIAEPFVGMDLTAARDGITDDRKQRATAPVGNDLGHDIAIAFEHPEYDMLVRKPAAFLAGANNAAHEGFVDLDGAREAADARIAVNIAHVFPDLMAHAPRRLVGHAELALHFLRRHAMPRRAEQEHHEKPIAKRSARPLERSSSRRKNLVTAPFASVGAPRLDAVETGLAPAPLAIVPRPVARPHEVIETDFLGREAVLKLAKGGAFRLHAPLYARYFYLAQGDNRRSLHIRKCCDSLLNPRMPATAALPTPTAPAKSRMCPLLPPIAPSSKPPFISSRA